MTKDLKLRHRVLVEASSRYQMADRAWQRGVGRAKDIFLGATGQGYWSIGNPGSRVRHLYDERDKALHHLNAAIFKLKVAKRRLEQTKSQPVILLIGAR